MTQLSSELGARASSRLQKCISIRALSKVFRPYCGEIDWEKIVHPIDCNCTLRHNGKNEGKHEFAILHKGATVIRFRGVYVESLDMFNITEIVESESN